MELEDFDVDDIDRQLELALEKKVCYSIQREYFRMLRFVTFHLIYHI